MKTVVTGGAGFVGSHLAAMLSEFSDCHVVDNLSTGKLANLPPDVTFHQTNTLDYEGVKSVVAGAQWVFHQAAIPSVELSVAAPRTTVQDNLAATLCVLDAARAEGVEKVVLASSAAVYGNMPGLPKIESMCPRPSSPYGLEKLASEEYARLFYELHGLRTTSLRYFNVYGPRQDPASQYAGVIPIFLRRASAGETIFIHGDGAQSRDFVYVSDVCRANILAARSTNADGRCLNIGTGTATTVVDLAAAVVAVTNSSSTIAHEEGRKGDIRDSVASVSLSGKLTEYRPEIDIHVGLKKTYEWFQAVAE